MIAGHYFFEIYTIGPKGETGWQIKVGFVLNAHNRTTAVERIKRKFKKKFDCVIQCHESNLFSLEGSDPVILHAR